MNKYNHGTFVTLFNHETIKIVRDYETILLQINEHV